MRNATYKGSLILALVLTLLFVTNAWPQAGIGSVNGSVRDQTGAVIPGATVTLKNTATNVTLKTTSNEAGMYMFPGIVAGHYDLIAEAPGMQKWEGSLTVQVAQSAVVDVALKIGQAVAQVTVNDVTPLLTTDSPTLSHTLERERIEQLPLNGRSVASLLQTVAGVETGQTTMRAYGQKTGSGEMILDGAMAGDRLWGYTVQRVPPGLDTIQEFRVEVNNSSAKLAVPTTMILSTKSGTNDIHGAAFETARNNAIGVARSRTDVSPTYTVPKLIRNEFGASAGGPVYIPKVYNGKNKTFWFFAYEAFRDREESRWVGQVPTASQRNGDMSSLIDSDGNLSTIYDPWTTNPVTWQRQQISYNGRLNVIDPKRISPLATQLFDISLPENYNPNGVPNYNMLDNNWRGVAPYIQDRWTTTARIDHRITDNDRIFGRYMHSNENVASQDWSIPFTADPSSPLNGIPGNVGRFGPNSSLALSYVKTLSPTFFNELLASASHDLRRKSTGKPGVKYADLMGLPNPLGVEGWPAMYYCGFSNYFFETDNTQSSPFSYFIVDDNVTKMKGKHELQFGFHWRADRLNMLPDQQYPQGEHEFDNYATSLYDPTTSLTNPGAVPYSGFGFAQLFLGVAAYRNVMVRNYYYARGRDWAAYLQDNYRVTPRLTLNLGLRWEYVPAYREKNGVMIGFDMANHAIVTGAPLSTFYEFAATSPVIINKYQSLGAKFETYDQAGLPQNLMYNEYKNFGPRLGMAYRLGDGSRSVVIRAGFRVSYFPIPVRSWGVTMRSNTPMTASFYGDSTNAATRSPDGIVNYKLRSVPQYIAGLNTKNVVSLTDPASVATLTRGSTSTLFFDPHQPTARTRDWNFTLEKEVAQNTVARVAYTGNNGRDLDQMIGLNSAPPTTIYYLTTHNPLPTGEYASVALRPYDQTVYGGITRYQRTGYSNYNGVQFELERRYTKGYGFQVFYVIGNAFTNTGMADQANTVNAYNQFFPGTVPADDNERNRLLYYGRDTSIPKHRIRWNWIVDLPFGKGKPLLGSANKILDRIVGGWQVAGMGSLAVGWFGLPTTVFPGLGSGKVDVYGYKYPIQDCTSGICYPGYLWWNGYLRADRINSHDPVTGLPNGYEGIPPNYQPAATPLWPYPANPDKNSYMWKNSIYGTNTIWVPLSNGANQKIGYSDNMAPWVRNMYLAGNRQWNVDASLFKRIPITERFSLRLNGDFFNVLNHPGNNNPGSNGIMSTSSGSNSPRVVQITARLMW